EEKSGALTQAMRDITQWHRDHCVEYGRILDLVTDGQAPVDGLEDVPFIPVRLLKELDMMSIEQEQVFKTMTSSGTRGQQVSRIYLDKETAAL
ncbi:acyl-protein synthetase, partial [Rhizobium ruizarguesonis]